MFKDCKIHFVLFSVLSSFFIYGNSLGSPEIFNIVGNSSNGQLLEISGSEFGDGPMIISWDDFENHTIGNSLESPIIGPQWSFQHPSNNTPISHYSDEQTFSGSSSAKVTWKEQGWSGYSINAFGWTNQGPFSSLYISYWRYHDPSDLSITDKNHKQIYCFGNASTSNSQDQQQFIPFMVPAGNRGYAVYIQSHPTRRFDYGQVRYSETSHTWNRWESYFEYEDQIENDNGYVEVWVDGSLVEQQFNQNFCDIDGGNFVHDVRIGHMFGGYNSMEYVRSYFDDLYISTSRARIEIGNSPVFSECTLREIQIPNEWTTDSISIQCHYSALQNSSTVYLFVVDSNGEASTGYEIQLNSLIGDSLHPGLPGQPYID